MHADSTYPVSLPTCPVCWTTLFNQPSRRNFYLSSLARRSLGGGGFFEGRHVRIKPEHFRHFIFLHKNIFKKTSGIADDFWVWKLAPTNRGHRITNIF